jgi:hypothetical protein
VERKLPLRLGLLFMYVRETLLCRGTDAEVADLHSPCAIIKVMASRPGDPTPATIKQLFALSGNKCAFNPFVVDPPIWRASCEQTLYEHGWEQTLGQIAHIRGERPGAARYDPSMTPDERRHFDNLLVLCPLCHRIIDNVAPDVFTIEILTEMKRVHEERSQSRNAWRSAGELDRAVALIWAEISAQPQEITESASVEVVSDTSAEAETAEATGTAYVASVSTADPQGAYPYTDPIVEDLETARRTGKAVQLGFPQGGSPTKLWGVRRVDRAAGVVVLWDPQTMGDSKTTRVVKLSSISSVVVTDVDYRMPKDPED